MLPALWTAVKVAMRCSPPIVSANFATALTSFAFPDVVLTVSGQLIDELQDLACRSILEIFSSDSTLQDVLSGRPEVRS